MLIYIRIATYSAVIPLRKLIIHSNNYLKEYRPKIEY